MSRVKFVVCHVSI